MVTVFPIDQKFSIDIYKDPKKKTAKDRVQIVVQPLRYKQKNLINSQCVSSAKGETYIDESLSIFLTLKHSIKEVHGLKDPSGKNFKLEFDACDTYQVLTDDCTEALINCELGYVLSFYAKDAINGTPHQLINPATFRPLTGVEFKPRNKTSKKK